MSHVAVAPLNAKCCLMLQDGLGLSGIYKTIDVCHQTDYQIDADLIKWHHCSWCRISWIVILQLETDFTTNYSWLGVSSAFMLYKVRSKKCISTKWDFYSHPSQNRDWKWISTTYFPLKARLVWKISRRGALTWFVKVWMAARLTVWHSHPPHSTTMLKIQTLKLPSPLQGINSLSIFLCSSFSSTLFSSR